MRDMSALSTACATLATALRGWVSLIWQGLGDWPTMTEQSDLEADGPVTQNLASRYGHEAPGYLTSNGRGSLEIGAADD